MTSLKPCWDQVDLISGGDHTFRLEVRDIINKELPEEILALKNSFLKADHDQVAFWLHKIKHKVGLMGLSQQVDRMKEAESTFRQNQSEPIEWVFNIADCIIDYINKGN